MKSRNVFFRVLLVVSVFAVGSAVAQNRGEAKPNRYLALGDSVAFGYINQAGFEYVNPANFVGFPAYVGETLNFAPLNAACPGETTSGFLSLTGVDNGCRYYRTHFPLHVPYASTQLDFATQFLQSHHQTRLVTITLGANDGFLLEASCASSANYQQCVLAGLPQLLATVASNMQTILADLRATGFDGVIVITNYYSLDYTDPVQTALTEALNQAITAPAQAYGAAVADVFTAFQKAASSPFAGGHTCYAGLLNANADQLTCDVHPSQSGHQLMAKTIASTYFAALGER